MAAGARLVRQYADDNDIWGWLACAVCHARVQNEKGDFVPCGCVKAAWSGGNAAGPRISESKLAGPGQKMAVKAAENFIRQWPNPKHGLYLHGPTGVGKTHIAQGIMNECAIKGASVAFWNVPEMIDNCKEAFSQEGSTAKTQAEYYAECMTVSLLILDDLAAERQTDFATEVIFGVIDRRNRSGLPLVITSNCEPMSLEKSTDKRVMSRILGMCETVAVIGHDMRRRGA